MARTESDQFMARRDRLAKACREEAVDAFLITDPINVSYLTGFSGDSSYLLIASGMALMLSDARFIEQIAEESPGLDALFRRPGETQPQAVAKAVAKGKFRRIAFESASTTVAGLITLQQDCSAVEFKPASGTVEALRAVKDAGEIKQIKRAIRIAEQAFTTFRSQLRGTATEKELADALDNQMRRGGATSAAFASILAVGPRAGLPHAVPTDRTLNSSPFLLVDWGAKERFYNSDCTRMVVTGKVGAKFEKIYQVVLEAQRKAIAAIRPGATGAEVDAVARSHIVEAGFGRAFGHGLGHGLGMQVHEAPSLRPGSTSVLEAGMVVTVEPGVYLKHWGGIRIEDVVLVTRDGGKVLTSLPTTLDDCRVRLAGDA